MPREEKESTETKAEVKSKVKNKKAKTETEAKRLCVDDLRHAEYYDMQGKFDELYADSLKGKIFTDLYDIIFSRENILLAYRNIKTNSGSHTPGTDKTTIWDIAKLTPDEVVEKVRFIVMGSVHGYRPKPVRRKEIPKPDGRMRPLGIPCMWDRLIQQCVKQVMEPICEAKFSDNSFAFRPNRSQEHAIAKVERLMNRSHMRYIVEFDIKGFFDNVNHKKLIHQIWTLGIRDKRLIKLLKRILKAPIRLPDGSTVFPTKGTPQGGIISPLLANIVLHELDYWIDSQWINHPATRKTEENKKLKFNKKGVQDKFKQYEAMRKKDKLKEMYIVRYADDFRIFCRYKNAAERIKFAVEKWLNKRLKLEISQEKTRIVNLKRQYSEFLGFKLRLHAKGKDKNGSKKLVVESHICDKKLKATRKELCEQAKRVARPHHGRTRYEEIKQYNAMVLGKQDYYQIATRVSQDARILQRATSVIFHNRLKNPKGSKLIKEGRKLTEFEGNRFGKSNMLRFEASTEEPIYPIGYVKHKDSMSKNKAKNSYTLEGRKGLHDNLRINTNLLLQLMRNPVRGQSIEYNDNRISRFSAQWGKCAVTGKEFCCTEEIHCHHKVPRKLKPDEPDKYDNLILVTDQVHRLVHATQEDTIQFYISLLNLDKKQLKKLNELRELVGNAEIRSESKRRKKVA